MRATEARLTDARLNEIRGRLLNPLNEDGLRAWYPNDVGALLNEVLTQRRIISESLHISRKNPALDQDTEDLVEASRRISDRWADIQKGVWARAETKRVREALTDAEQSVAQSSVVIAGQQARISQLQSEIESLQGRVVDTIAEARRAALDQQKVLSDKQAHITQTEAELAHLQAHIVNTVASAKQAIAQLQAEHAARAARAEALVNQAVAALRD